ncbi:hypothetical protein [Paenibacillus sp. JSM ZJ436]|uniref:hypothetical protein n=1 Tax=Paenibacillus sp. JSM ZJ436 TaxID=3376190 RepID=UPI0037C9F7FE
MKRYVMTLAAVVFTFVGLTGIRIDIHASSADPLISTVPKSIKKYVHSINNEDWESYVNSYSPDRRLTNFPSEAQRNSRTGILSVKSIEISEIKEISEKDIHEVQPLNVKPSLGRKEGWEVTASHRTMEKYNLNVWSVPSLFHSRTRIIP